MQVSHEELEARIEALSDKELLRMLTGNPQQYRPDALALAKDEAARRNLDMDSNAAAKSADESSMADRLVEAAKSGIDAAKAAMKPAGYRAVGKKIICPHCHHDQFKSQASLLNTRGLTFFKLDWLDAGATALICSNCGMIQWFRIEPELD